MADLSKQWEFVERVARERGASSEAVRKWRERGKVPHRWRLPISDEARDKRFKLDPAVFDNVPQVA